MADGKIKKAQIDTTYDLVPSNVAADSGKVLTAGATDRTSSWQTPSTGVQAYAAGSTSVGSLAYNGTTKADGKLYGGTTAPTNTTRVNYDGYFYATKTFNPQYITADIAECFDRCDNAEPGDIIEFYNGNYVKAGKHRNNLLGAVSDTYGHLLGGSPEDIDAGCKIAIGLTGRVPVKVKGKGKSGNYIVSSRVPGVGKAVKRPITGRTIGRLLFDKTDKATANVMIFIDRR